MGYAEIRSSLQGRNRPADGMAIEAWLLKAGLIVSAKTVSTLLRCFDRVSAAGEKTLLCLEKMESVYAGKVAHFFSMTSVLSTLCERTACPKHP